MNREEAHKILSERVRTLRGHSYKDLLHYLHNASADEIIASSGKPYQIEVEAMWDGQPDSDLRVVVTIDDGSLRWATVPLVEDFIIRPDGTFVGD